MHFLYIPWDFVLILAFLAILIPWRGQVRIRRLLNNPAPTSSDRMSLYRSTIVFQWLLLLVVAWRCFQRSVDPVELGISLENPWPILWTTLGLTLVLCLNQVFGLRKLASVPVEERGSFAAITERIMPRGGKEIFLFAALAVTAGISEEFLFRGFVFAAFVRMLVNYTEPNVPAAMLESAWFSLAHLYQGKRGLITTFVVGLVFSVARIWTGSLLPVITAHIGIDLIAGLYASKYLGKVSPNATGASD